MKLAGTLDNKELRALRKVDMPLAVTQDPWLRLDAALRHGAVEAWETLTAGTTPG
jgi:hypothetical protein